MFAKNNIISTVMVVVGSGWCFTTSGPRPFANMEGILTSAVYQKSQEKNVCTNVSKLKLKSNWFMSQEKDLRTNEVYIWMAGEKHNDRLGLVWPMPWLELKRDVKYGHEIIWLFLGNVVSIGDTNKYYIIGEVSLVGKPSSLSKCRNDKKNILSDLLV